MPINKYYKGHGDEVMSNMKREYGDEAREARVLRYRQQAQDEAQGKEAQAGRKIVPAPIPPQPSSPAYSQTTWVALRQALAARLNDPGMVFWTDGQLAVELWNAMRFWNALTGDNRVWWNLTTTPGTVWYDLQALAGSPRKATVQDVDIYSWLQYALLEPQLPNAQLGTAQFSTNDIVTAVQNKRDQFLMRSSCTSSVLSLNVSPLTPTLFLPPKVIQPRRGYWLPVTPGALASPLMRLDEYGLTAYARLAAISPGDPQTFSAGMEPPLTVALSPPPASPGAVEFLILASQGALMAGSPMTLYLPSDFAPGIFWGALADLLDSSMEQKDAPRAAYARQRFDQHVELMTTYPFITGVRVAGLPIYTDAVETLDTYQSGWRTVSTNPSVMGLSGQNLLAWPSSDPAQVTLQMLAPAALPQMDNDPVPYGQEVLDALLDYAQHTASFKMGGEEFQSTLPLFKSMVDLAATRNAKVLALATFKNVLYTRPQREAQFAPTEVTA